VKALALGRLRGEFALLLCFVYLFYRVLSNIFVTAHAYVYVCVSADSDEGTWAHAHGSTGGCGRRIGALTTMRPQTTQPAN
jgi:hypothetical protein